MGGRDGFKVEIGKEACVIGPDRGDLTMDTVYRMTVDDVDDEWDNEACGRLQGFDEEVCLPVDAFFDCAKEPKLLSRNFVFVNAGNAYNKLRGLAVSQDSASVARQKLGAAINENEKASLDLDSILFRPLGYRPFELVAFEPADYGLGGYCATLFDYSHDLAYYVWLAPEFGVRDIVDGLSRALAYKQIIEVLKESSDATQGK